MIVSAKLQLIKDRRSIRAYTGEQVQERDLQAILEAAMYAPSPGGSQPWFFTVIQNRELIKELSEASKEVARNKDIEFLKALGNNPEFHAFHNAPTVIIVSGDAREPFATAACAAATQNMLLAAEFLGLGACWVNFGLLVFEGYKGDIYREKLGIPGGYKPLFSVTLGYRRGDKPQAAPRKSNIVNYIR
nr:nitroreductase family protein [Moorella sulfitireducens]